MSISVEREIHGKHENRQTISCVVFVFAVVAGYGGTTPPLPQESVGGEPASPRPAPRPAHRALGCLRG